jgi:3-oxoadipate enol-lactonase
VISYLDEGAGPTVVFLHGLGTNKACWDAQAAAFSKTFRIIRPDLRGFGQSPKIGPYGVDIFATDIIALLDRLSAWPATIVGTSMGGYVALAIALREQARLDKLVLCHTACSRRVPPDVMAERLAALHAGDMSDYARVAAKTAIAPTAAAALQARVIEMIGANDQAAFIDIFSGTTLDFDYCSSLSTIRIPTLVITSPDDKVVPYARSLQLHDNIPGAKLEEIAGVGHLSYMEKPEAFNRALGSFLSAF